MHGTRQATFDQIPINMSAYPAHLLLAIAICAAASTKAQTIANAGPDQETCFDTSSMQANTPLPTEIGFWALSSGTATITDASDPMTTVTGIDFGQSVLRWTIITSVDTSTDQVSIMRYYADPAIPYAGPDQTLIAPPFSATMGAAPPIFPQVCTWSVIQGTGVFSNPNSYYATVTDLSLGANIFRWTSDSGICHPLSTDDVVITVELSTSIGVDANNRSVAMWFDNASGVLRIVGDVQANSISILNSLGQAIELRTKPTSGTLDLSALQPGSYFATATIRGTRKILRFVVKR